MHATPARRLRFRTPRLTLASLRYLALDLGSKRTGLAVGDDVTHIVTPIEVLRVSRAAGDAALMDAIVSAIDTHGPGAIVIGLPINMDDTEGPAAQSARAFGTALASRTSLPVHYQDERLTSFAAEQQLAGTGRTQKEKRALVDTLAAAQILRDFLASRSPGSQRSAPTRNDEHNDECG